MNTAKEYPKHMSHPAFVRGTVKAVVGEDPVSGKKFTDYQGTPDRFAPVDVTSADEEAQYRAKGYQPFGEAAVGAVGYLEYPKMLAHPDHEPATQAIAATVNGGGQIVTPEIPGRAAKFAPVTVKDQDEEAEAMRKGYRAPGTPDPDAVQAAISSPYDPNRVTQEYPKVVNGRVVHDPGVDRSGVQEYPKWINIEGHPHGGKTVDSREEEEALTGKKTEAAAAKPPTSPASETKFERAQRLKAEADAAMAVAQAEMDAEEARAVQSAETVTAAPQGQATINTPPPPSDRAALFADLTARGIPFSNRWNTDKLRKALEAQQAA